MNKNDAGILKNFFRFFPSLLFGPRGPKKRDYYCATGSKNDSAYKIIYISKTIKAVNSILHKNIHEGCGYFKEFFEIFSFATFWAARSQKSQLLLYHILEETIPCVHNNLYLENYRSYDIRSCTKIYKNDASILENFFRFFLSLLFGPRLPLYHMP